MLRRRALLALADTGSANNIINYTASDKLTETTSILPPGLHTEVFNATITSHTFSNGAGVIEFNADLTSIGNQAFRGCTGLTSITIPSSVTTIGNNVFFNCSNLESITCYATTAPTVTSSTFRAINTYGTLYVPAGSRNSYNTWMETGNYYLGKYYWWIEEV